MNLQDFYNRINLDTDLSNISKDLCDKYKLGVYIEDKVLQIGYEDFNYILTTSIGKYFIKILYNGRDKKEVESYVERIESITKSKVNFPKVLRQNNQILYNLKIKETEYRIIVFEYIDGENLFTLKYNLNDLELQEIAKQIQEIHNINCKPTFIYDSWAICNFIKEYEQKKNVIPRGYVNEIEKLYEEYKKIDYKRLPHAFVHGDIMNTNVMKDSEGKLWIIDIAVSNYLPRINDLSVSMANLCTINESEEESCYRISVFLKEYMKMNELVNYEIDCLKLFYAITSAMYLLQSSYQMSLGNQSEENKYWFHKGVFGLELSKKEKFMEIFKVIE